MPKQIGASQTGAPFLDPFFFFSLPLSFPGKPSKTYWELPERRPRKPLPQSKKAAGSKVVGLLACPQWMFGPSDPEKGITVVEKYPSCWFFTVAEKPKVDRFPFPPSRASSREVRIRLPTFSVVYVSRGSPLPQKTRM